MISELSSPISDLQSSTASDIVFCSPETSGLCDIQPIFGPLKRVSEFDSLQPCKRRKLSWSDVPVLNEKDHMVGLKFDLTASLVFCRHRSIGI